MSDERVLLTSDWLISGFQAAVNIFIWHHIPSNIAPCPPRFTLITGLSNCHHSLTIIFSPDLKVICDWKSWNENRILKNFVLWGLIFEPNKPIKFQEDPKYLPFKLETSKQAILVLLPANIAYIVVFCCNDYISCFSWSFSFTWPCPVPQCYSRL